MKSSRKTRDQILDVLSARKAERVLIDWANHVYSVDGDSATRRLIERYPEIFNPYRATTRQLKELYPNLPLVFSPSPGLPIKAQSEIAALFGMLLRKAWDAREQRRRDWYLTDAESFYHHATNRFGDPPTHATPIEAVLFYFRHNINRTRHCPNSHCPAPYFFATKKGQEYCSAECAKPAQRAAKLRWWHENKNAVNRRMRRKAAKSTRNKKGAR